MTTRTSVQTIRPSSSIASGLAVLAEPPTRQVDGAMMDYFLIEVVNTLKASAAVATARAKQIEKEMVDSGLIPPPASTAPPSLPLKKDSVRESITGRPASTPTTKVPEDEEEAVRTRLENIGIHVGANFTERRVNLRLEYECKLTCPPGYVGTGHCSGKRSMRSSSFAKIFGGLAGTNRWTTFERTIGCVACFAEHPAISCQPGNLCFTRQCIQADRPSFVLPRQSRSSGTSQTCMRLFASLAGLG